MPNRYSPIDERFFRDLWFATKPQSDEHRLSFTVKLTTLGSASLRNSGAGFITAALTLVRVSLRPENPRDIVVVVERNKKATQTKQGTTVDLHIHGWLRISNAVSAEELQKRMNKRAKHKSNLKIWPKRGWDFADMNPKTGKPVDVGWPNYIDKDFNRWPTGCIAASHRYSATGHTKSLARMQGRKRRDNFRKIKRYCNKQDRQILRKEGEWECWPLGYERV